MCADFNVWLFGPENSSEESGSSKKGQQSKQCLSGQKNRSEVKGHGHRHRGHRKKQQKNPARIRSGHVKELVAADLKALATTAKEDPTYDPHNEGLLLVDRDIYMTLKEGKTTSSLFTAKTTGSTKLSASGHPMLDRHPHSNSSIKSKTNATTKTVTFKVKSKTNESKKTNVTATAAEEKGATVVKGGKRYSLLSK